MMFKNAEQFSGDSSWLGLASKLLLLTSAMCVVPPLFADVLTVDQSAGPFYDIQSAIHAAQSGDSILIGPGIYAEHLSISDISLKLEGNNQADATIIDGSAKGRPITVQGDGTTLVLSNLTIQNGRSQTGGGLLSEGVSLELSNVAFLHNQAKGQGGGFRATGANIRVDRVLALGNVATAGGGAYISDVERLDVVSSEFVSNRGHMGSGLRVEDASGLITSTLFLANGRTADGQGVPNETTLHVTASRGRAVDVLNNTFVDSGCCNISLRGKEQGQMANNIFANGDGFGVYMSTSVEDGWAESHVRYNNFYQNATGDFFELEEQGEGEVLSLVGSQGNLGVLPEFVQASGADGWPSVNYGLADSSPLIDQGMPLPMLCDGDGTRADLGLEGGPWGDTSQ